MNAVSVHGIDLSKRSHMNAMVYMPLERRGLKMVPLYGESHYVLTLGIPAFQAVTGLLDLDEARGKILRSADGRLTWSTYHPGQALHSQWRKTFLQEDIRDFIELIKFDQGAYAKLD